MNRLFLLAAACFATALAGGAPTIKTVYGRVQGKHIVDDIIGADYNAYRCIPFAKPPVKSLRFQAPQRPTPWHDVRESLDSCPVCPQFQYVTNVMVGQEDCLYLNVYVPKNPTAEKDLPVMVWFFGGEWRAHSGTFDVFDPSFLMSQSNVILVTFNHRLGPLGFLSTGDEIVPGNNGLKDQNMALKWVQENIRNFGGSPRKVTIFGCGTGAASVRYQMLSTSSKDLFRAAISQSGNELDTWAWQSTSEAVSLYRRLARSLNCTSFDNEAAIDCMKHLPAESIIEAEGNTFEGDLRKRPFMIFKPVTEVPNENAFLCKNPIEMLKNGEGSDVPLILGLTQSDGAYAYTDYWSHDHDVIVKPEWILPTSSPAFRVEYGQTKHIAERVYDRYLRNLIGGDSVKLRDSMIHMITDAWYRLGHETLITYLRKHYSAPIYQYRLSYVGEHSFVNWGGYPDKLDASHYDDDIYLYPSTIYFHHTELNENDTAMWKRYVELWTNFATYLNPTPSAHGDVCWDPISTSRHEYLDIAGPNDLSMKSSMYSRRTDFWKNLACEFTFDSVHCQH